MELATSTFRDEPVRDWGWQYRIVIMNFDYELVEDGPAGMLKIGNIGF